MQGLPGVYLCMRCFQCLKYGGFVHFQAHRRLSSLGNMPDFGYAYAATCSMSGVPSVRWHPCNHLVILRCPAARAWRVATKGAPVQREIIKTINLIQLNSLTKQRTDDLSVPPPSRIDYSSALLSRYTRLEVVAILEQGDQRVT